MTCASGGPSRAWLFALVWGLSVTPSWSSPSSMPAEERRSPTARLLQISDELVSLSDELVMQLEKQVQTATESKTESIDLSRPLDEDLTSLGTALETVSTSLDESAPLLVSSETGFETSHNLMLGQIQGLEVERDLWRGGAVAAVVLALAALSWGATR